MIGTVLAEVKASADADLPGNITAIAGARGVTLTSSFLSRTWEKSATEADRTTFPVLDIIWEAGVQSQTKRPAAGVRDTDVPIKLHYQYKDTVLATVKTHAEFVPEAILRWLDNFPISTKNSAKTIWMVQPPDGTAIRVDAKLENARGDGGGLTYIWDAAVHVVFRCRDTLDQNAVSTVTVAPATATVAIAGTQQLTATLRDAGSVVLTGRPVAWTSSTAAVATVDSTTGLVTGVGAGTAYITATCEGKAGICIVTVAASVLSPVSSGLLVSWYPNQGSGQVVTDLSGNGRHAQLGTSASADTNDPAWFADAPGNKGVFHSYDDILKLNGLPSISAGYTFHQVWCWQQPQPGGGNLFYMSVEAGVDTTNQVLRMCIGPAGAGGLATRIQHFNGAATQNFDTSHIPTVGAWFDLCAFFDGTNLSVEVNGTSVLSTTSPAMDSFGGIACQLVTGAVYYSAAAGLQGVVGGAQLWYARALTALERATNRAYLKSLYPGLP